MNIELLEVLMWSSIASVFGFILGGEIEKQSLKKLEGNCWNTNKKLLDEIENLKIKNENLAYENARLLYKEKESKLYNTTSGTFDRHKIISNTKKAELGKPYYFSTSISHLEEVVKTDNKDFCGILTSIDKDLFYMKDGYLGWKYIYPCK